MARLPHGRQQANACSAWCAEVKTVSDLLDREVVSLRSRTAISTLHGWALAWATRADSSGNTIAS